MDRLFLTPMLPRGEGRGEGFRHLFSHTLILTLAQRESANC